MHGEKCSLSSALERLMRRARWPSQNINSTSSASNAHNWAALVVHGGDHVGDDVGDGVPALPRKTNARAIPIRLFAECSVSFEQTTLYDRHFLFIICYSTNPFLSPVIFRLFSRFCRYSL